ncbi:MAG: fluoride efflux transporter CrcB [Cyclobacteriaceae bacterium]
MNWDFLWVGLGGFLGSISRYWVGVLTSRFWVGLFPLGTFMVNMIGCFLIGLLFGWWFKGHITDSMSRLWITGFCGGFTTFSSFSYESLTLLEEGKMGVWGLYLASSILIGLLATLGGISLIRQW